MLNIEIPEILYPLPAAGLDFPIPFSYSSTAEHEVFLLGANNEVLSELVFGVDWSISPEGPVGPNTGTLTLVNAPAATNAKLYLKRKTALKQNYSPTPGAEGVAAQLDRNVMALQEENLRSGRELKVGPENTLDLTLPDLGEGQTFMRQGDVLVPGPDASEIADAQVHAVAARTSAEQAALFDGVQIDTVPLLLLDTTMTYTTGQPGTIVAGDIVEAGGYRYLATIVGLGDIQNSHPTTPVHLKVLASNGRMFPEMLGAVNDGVADDLLVLDAISSLASSLNATLFLSGSYAISAKWVIPDGIVVETSGLGNCEIRGTFGFDDNMVVVGDECNVSGLRIVIPNTSTFDALTLNKLGDSETDSRGTFVHEIQLTGGDDASAFALSMTDSFSVSLKNINIRTSMNGVKISNEDNVFNYGNSTVDRVEISLTTAPRIGWDIKGVAGTKNYNLMCFTYISAVTSFGTGSTALRIQNCGQMTFVSPDFEGMDTSIEITGGVSGGAAAQSNVFTALLADGDVTLNAGTHGTVFLGGRIHGVFTNNATNTKAVGLLDASQDLIVIDPFQEYVATGPRFTPSGLTVDLRNQTGAIFPKGTVGYIAAVDWGFQKADETKLFWTGVAIEDIAIGTNGPMCISGITPILSSTAAVRGDAMVLDTGGNAGKVKSIGAVAPIGAQVLVGYAAATGVVGLIDVVLK